MTLIKASSYTERHGGIIGMQDSAYMKRSFSDKKEIVEEIYQYKPLSLAGIIEK